MKKIFLIIIMSYLLLGFIVKEKQTISNNTITLDLTYQTASLNQLKTLSNINMYIKEFLEYRYVKTTVDKTSIIIYIISEKYNLDPMLITSMILHESSFNPKAESVMGAKGMMQVMWSVWSDKLIENNICKVESDLFNEVKNIDAGCFVLRHYIDIFGSVEIALQRYFGISSYSKIYSENIMGRM